MANILKVTGVKAVLRKMIKGAKTFENEAGSGLLRGGRFVQRESQKIVPVLTTNLKGTADTVNIGGKGFDTDIVVSYGTDYGVYVHENLDARHKEGKKAKFLESIFRDKRKELFEVIAGKR